MNKLIALLIVMGILMLAGCPKDNPAGDAWKTGGETGTAGGTGSTTEDTTTEDTADSGM